MGSVGFLILYMAAGIFGNVLGGNFALVGIPSLGASGAIFGTVAVSPIFGSPWPLAVSLILSCSR
jgi:membrane associated rhomboid family serine protease